MGSSEGGTGSGSGREGLGFDGGKESDDTKGVAWGGMQIPIASAAGDEKWANSRRAGPNPCLGVLYIPLPQPHRQQNPAASCIPNLPLTATPDGSAQGIVFRTSKTRCHGVGPAVPGSAGSHGRGGKEPCLGTDRSTGIRVPAPPLPAPLLPPLPLAGFRNSD